MERKKSEYTIKQIAVIDKANDRIAYFDALRQNTAITIAASTVENAAVKAVDEKIEALKAKFDADVAALREERKVAAASGRENFDSIILPSTQVRELGNTIVYTDLVGEEPEGGLKVSWYQIKREPVAAEEAPVDPSVLVADEEPATEGKEVF